MMDRFTFTPLFDVPLIATTVGAFLWHFNVWGRSRTIEPNIDLADRLPTARRRVLILFISILIFCWLSNLAVWSLFAVLLGIGIALAFISGGDVVGGEIGFWGAAFFIREWAFGFPHMILDPPDAPVPTSSSDFEAGELMGKSGFATDPIRPTGHAEIDNVRVSVSSADGRLIEAGTEVTVTMYRNGRPCVSPRT